MAVPTDFLDHPTPIAFAHRGGAGHFAENSWRAFEHAVKLGYAYLETDVRVTADGELIAFHDRNLERVTDASGAIARLPASEVTAADRQPSRYRCWLTCSARGRRVNIDVKDCPAARPLADLIRKLAAWDRVCITSFSTARLRATRRLLDRPVCMATSPVGAAALRSGLPGRLLRPALASRWVRCAQLPIGLASVPLIGRAHRAGLQVHVWTVNDRDLMTSLLDRAVDGIMTANTELLCEVLIDRGEWHPRA
jgi:glycerophosphoryl diester phosphodiesterase